MSFQLPSLPYSKEALMPFMSEETLEFHYGKHHQAYVNNLNKLIDNNSAFKKFTLEDLIKETYNKDEFKGIYNNAAQHYNHIEFWNSMSKNSSKGIPSKVEKVLDLNFGSVENFKNEFITKGSTLFGSGWVWLLSVNNKLEIRQYANGENPLSEGFQEILGCDVWEHSYYIDYRNNRAEYLNQWFENLINWEYIESKLKN